MTTKSSLTDDLVAIPGVEGAELEGEADALAGIRIQVSESADQDKVGGAIRRVLNVHGLGAGINLPGESVDQEARRVAVLTATDASFDSDADRAVAPSEYLSERPPEDETGTIIDLTNNPGKDQGAAVADAPLSDDGGESERTEETDSWDDTTLPSFVQPRSRVLPEPTEPTEPTEPGEAVARIDRISVEESRSGAHIMVVASDGTQVSQIASLTEGAVEDAVVKATVKLANLDAPDVVVVEIVDWRIEGRDIVTIILDVDGDVKVGSAVVGVGRVFALGRATWAALAL